MPPGLPPRSGGGVLPKAAPNQYQGYNDLQSVWNIMFPLAAPQIQQAVNQYGMIQGQLNMLPAMYGQQVGNVQQNELIGLKRLGLQGESLGVQRGANTRQLPLENSMFGITQGQHKLNKENLAMQYADTKRHGELAVNTTESQQAGAGSLFTAGSRDSMANLKADIHSQLAGINRAKEGERLSYKGETLQHQERVMSIKDEKKMIDITAKGLGVSYEEIVNRAQQAITQLGLDQMMTTSQLFQALSDAANGIYSPLTNIAGSVLQYAGLGGATSGATGTGGSSANPNITPQKAPGSMSAFIQQVLPDAKIAASQLGIPTSVVLAQWINETGSGSSGGWTKGYNPAGIMSLTSDMRAVGGYAGPNGYVYFPNQHAGMMGYVARWDDGVYANTRAQWAAAKGDPYATARAVQNSPWAAGHYGGHGLEDLIRQYNLTQY